MKLTQPDGSIIDTEKLDDATALFIEKGEELHQVCQTHKIPFICFGVTRTGGEKSSVFFSIHHPTDDAKTVTARLLNVNLHWWNKILLQQTVALLPGKPDENGQLSVSALDKTRLLELVAVWRKAGENFGSDDDKDIVGRISRSMLELCAKQLEEIMG